VGFDGEYESHVNLVRSPRRVDYRTVFSPLAEFRFNDHDDDTTITGRNELKQKIKFSVSALPREKHKSS